MKAKKPAHRESVCRVKHVVTRTRAEEMFRKEVAQRLHISDAAALKLDIRWFEEGLESIFYTCADGTMFWFDADDCNELAITVFGGTLFCAESAAWTEDDVAALWAKFKTCFKLPAAADCFADLSPLDRDRFQVAWDKWYDQGLLYLIVPPK